MTLEGVILLLLIIVSLVGLNLYLAVQLRLSKRRSIREANAAKRQRRGSKEN